MMRYTRSFLGLLIFLAISAEGLAGIWTTNEFFYKPGLGARGEREKSTYDSGLDRVDVRLAKEVWVGDPKFGATLQDALTTLGATTALLRVPKGTYNLDANLTIPPNITLKPERGAIFAIANTKTLTVNGGLEAGLYQIFSCAGTGKAVFAPGSNQTIFPQWWGASPNASAAVNTAAMQASFNAIANQTSWTLPPGIYTCNAPLVVGDYPEGSLTEIEMDFRGQLLFDSCSGLDIRGVTHSNLRGINVKRLTRDWTANNFGVKFSECTRDNIELKSIQNFTYGFYLNGDDWNRYNAYLTFHLGFIIGNQYGQYVTGDNYGWNNENNYQGGQFGSTGETYQTYLSANVSTANNTISFPSANITWPTGTAVFIPQGMAGPIAAPLIAGTTYYLILVDAHTVKLATSYSNAMAGTAIDLTTQGGGSAMGLAGSWAVYFKDSTSIYDNHRWYGPSVEGIQNGFYLAGYNGALYMSLYSPRFEMVGNWIEAAPRNLLWIQGSWPISRDDMSLVCPRLDITGQSNVNIIGSGDWSFQSYLPYATPRDVGGFTFYNPQDLRQVTNLRHVTKDYFTPLMEEAISDASALRLNTRWTISYPMNKGYQGAAAPASPANPMTYAKNAIAWNTNVASGQPMGWVCSTSGSVTQTTSITGTGDVTGTTLTITTRGATYYFFVGAFIKINGVQHQLKANPVPDTGGAGAVWTLYANNLGGNVTGAALADSPPTWVAMPNFP